MDLSQASTSSCSPEAENNNFMKDSEPCLICSAPTLERHFQVMSCNACAAFFRRSIKTKTSYKCQRSHGNCNVSLRKIGKPLCRYCRLKKCFSVGMKGEENSTVKLPKQKQSPPEKQEKINNHPQDPHFPSSKSTNADNEKVFYEIQRILQESRSPTAAGTLRPTSAFKETLSKFLLKPGKLLILMSKEANRDRGQYYETFMTKVAHLLMNIDTFALMPFSQKFALYKRFWQMFQLLLNCYQGFICYGNDLSDTRYPIDTEHFIDLETTIHNDHSEATLFLLPILKKSQLLLLHVKKASPTVFEFAYICQLILWSCAEVEDLTFESCQLAEEMIHKASDELHEYYFTEIHMKNYAARQAELIQIVRQTDYVFRDKKQLMAANQVFNFMGHNLKMSILT